MNENTVKTRENGKVFIRMSVYKDILTHALRFANVTFDNEQVIGFCLGIKKPDSDDIDVIKAIPITHGDQVELGFSEKIHKSLEQLKEEVKDENYSVVGWYHSHPNSDSFFFSDVDKKNHLYFQNEQNPLAFGIVFDPSQLNKAAHLGLEVFQLKNHKLGEKSGIVRVKNEIEPPKSLDFFKWVRELVEYGQEKDQNIIR